VELIIADNPRQWQDFAAALPRAEFLNAACWPTVIGPTAKYLLMIEEGKILAGCPVFEKRLFGLRYGYSPRGPLFAPGLGQEKMRRALGLLAEQSAKVLPSVVFWRMEPVCAPVVWAEISRGLVVRKSVNQQPAQTLVIDLAASEDELLAAMHQKTRYNARLAEKKGVVVRQGTLQDFPAFWKLMSQTGERDAFRLHTEHHYRRMLEKGSDVFKLFVAETQGRVLAAGIFAFFGDTATYVHGASASQDRQYMAPYALQWQVMTFAKKQGYRYYDFFGVDNSKWPGVTRFKMGFGGSIEAYPGTFDIILKAGYYKFYQAVRQLRRLLPF